MITHAALTNVKDLAATQAFVQHLRLSRLQRTDAVNGCVCLIQESAKKLTEAQELLAEVTKAEDAAEAERQAALALEPWPPDARIAPSSPQPHPPAKVQAGD